MPPPSRPYKPATQIYHEKEVAKKREQRDTRLSALEELKAKRAAKAAREAAKITSNTLPASATFPITNTTHSLAEGSCHHEQLNPAHKRTHEITSADDSYQGTAPKAKRLCKAPPPKAPSKTPAGQRNENESMLSFKPQLPKPKEPTNRLTADKHTSNELLHSGRPRATRTKKNAYKDQPSMPPPGPKPPISTTIMGENNKLTRSVMENRWKSIRHSTPNYRAQSEGAAPQPPKYSLARTTLAGRALSVDHTDPDNHKGLHFEVKRAQYYNRPKTSGTPKDGSTGDELPSTTPDETSSASSKRKRKSDYQNDPNGTDDNGKTKKPRLSEDSGYETGPSSPKSPKPPTNPKGLYNRSRNACYSNAVLQSIAHCVDSDELRGGLENVNAHLGGLDKSTRTEIRQTVKLGILGDLSVKAECLHVLDQLQSSSEGPMDPYTFQRVYGRFHPDFSGETQEDVALYFGDLLDRLGGDVVDGKLNIKDNDFLDKNFKIGTADKKTCRNCGNISLTSCNPNWLLKLETDFTKSASCRSKKLPKEHITLDNLLEQNLSKSETIDDFTCEHCGKKGIAKGWAGLQVLPNTIVAQFPRSALNPKTTNPYKLGYEVELPAEYNFTNNSAYPYKLVAVIKHAGNTMRQGHYVAYTMTSDGQWWLRNDEDVKEADFDDVNAKDMHGHTYLAFYKKVEQI